MEPQGAGICFFCKHMWIFDPEGIENFWKILLKVYVQINFFPVICQRNTQWSSAYSRICSPNTSTNSPGTDSEEARVVFFSWNVLFIRDNVHLFFLLLNKCHRLFIFMSAAQVFSMKDMPLHRLHSKRKMKILHSASNIGSETYPLLVIIKPWVFETVEELLTENYNFLLLICFLCLDAGA